jgi:hypothetical protein
MLTVWSSPASSHFTLFLLSMQFTDFICVNLSAQWLIYGVNFWSPEIILFVQEKHTVESA